jgi:hypothetical protein
VKRRMERSGNPNDRFVCKVLASNLRARCQRMALGQGDHQFIVPNTMCFEALSIGRQLDDPRL